MITPHAPSTEAMRAITVETEHGLAAAHLLAVEEPRGALVLGHGAGGSITAPDLRAATRAAHLSGLTVVLVEQPYRVAGRRAPPRAPTLDAAWTAVLDHLSRTELLGLRLVVGGRSSGARVACRNAAATGARGVLCLAFPLQPARRADAAPAPSRIAELDAVEVPVLVVQGLRDPFGVPPAANGRTVVTLAGDHALKADLPGVERAVAAWLPVAVRPAS